MRRGGALLLATSLAAIVVGGTTSRHPAAADTVELGSFAMSATAPAVEITEDEPNATAHPEGQGTIPMTSTTLSTGPIGYALSTIFWPGPLAGNAGSLLQLLAPTSFNGVAVPDAVQQAIYPNLTAANDPLRAEARSGSSPDGKLDAPGMTLTAHADDKAVNANAAVNGSEQPGLAKFGGTQSQSSSKLAADKSSGEATASSSVSNVELGGVIKIGSVASDAAAKTDGKTATASGHITVHDMTVAGQRAYVDDKGFHIGDANQPINAVANQLAAQSLANAGFEIYVSTPRTEIKGATAVYNAGSLIVQWKPPSSPNTIVYVFGNSRVAVDSTLGDPSLSALADTPTVDTTPAAVVPAASSTVTPTDSGGSAGGGDTSSGGFTDTGTSGGTGGVGSADIATNPETSPTADGGAGGSGGNETALPLTPALATTNPFAGVPVGWVLAALAGVGLVAAGCKRVTDDILERAATACPLER